MLSLLFFNIFEFLEWNQSVQMRDIDATLTKILDVPEHKDDVKKDDAFLHATANTL